MTDIPNLRKLLELADAVERATGPDRELDYAIADAVLGPIRAPFRRGHCEKYTASLDAAMSLVPEGWGWQVSDSGNAGVWFIDRNKPEPPDDGWRFPLIDIQASAKAATPTLALTAATPTLALTAAALRARAALSETQAPTPDTIKEPQHGE